MTTTRTVFTSATFKIVDYVCASTPHDPLRIEQHTSTCLAFTCAGSYGYEVRGTRHQLVSGSFLVGSRGDEYTCTHEYYDGGDRCLSIQLSPALVDELGGSGVSRAAWERGFVPAIAELVILGRLVEATVRGLSDLGADEAALALCTRFVELAASRPPNNMSGPSHRDRKRAVDAALWMAANANRPLTLDDAAATAELSPYHFLRVFSRTLGVTPHQYLVRTRLAMAAELIATDESREITDVALTVGFEDLSNFVRTFRRASGITPTEFRRLARGDRKILQARFAAAP
jgi:AraC-like DNA-binding protein